MEGSVQTSSEMEGRVQAGSGMEVSVQAQRWRGGCKLRDGVVCASSGMEGSVQVATEMGVSVQTSSEMEGSVQVGMAPSIRLPGACWLCALTQLPGEEHHRGAVAVLSRADLQSWFER